MASARDIPLTKAEQEEEEMRTVLEEAGLFEENMPRHIMKQMMQVVQESKESSIQNIQTPPTSPLLNESTTPTQNILEASACSTERPLPSFSYRNAMVPQSTSSEEQLNSKENSPESALNKTYGKNLNNENISPDSEQIFEKNSSLKKDNYPMLRSKSNIKSNTFDTSKLRPQENKKQNSAALRRLNIQRWKMNPFNSEEDVNAVPLQKPEHSFAQETPEETLPYDIEDIDSELFDELFQQMSAKLNRLHEMFIMSDIPTRDKSPWGSPIKVATKWNGSLDKNPFVEDTSALRSSRSPEVSVRESHDRATKRKALCTIAAATYDASNDENSDDEFSNTKKRKCLQGKKAGEAAKKNQESQKNKASVSSVEMIEVDDNKNLSDLEMFDNSNIRNIRKKSTTKSSTTLESIDEQSEYPRRIAPPNPAKKNFKGPRAKKKTANNATQSQNDSMKKSLFLNDEEINKTLLELDEEIDNNYCVDITDEIKPLSISKNLPKKLHMACSQLVYERDAEENRMKAAEEAKKQKEMEEKLKKDELISKRLQQQEDEHNYKLEKEKKFNEQQALYKNILDPQKRTSQRITRSNFKAKSTYDNMNEDLLLDGDDEPTISQTNLGTQSPCPICQKSFPVDQIETHASECDAFSSESDEISNHQPSSSYSRNSRYDCQICNEYKTCDGNRYEEHVNRCKVRAEDKRNGIYLSN